MIPRDLNGDLSLEIPSGLTDSMGYHLNTLLNDGLGNFTRLPMPSSIDEYMMVAVGDSDGDGDMDFIGNLYNISVPGPEAIWLNQNQ